MTAIPPVLLRYVAGLQGHAVAGIAGTVGDNLAFVATTGRILSKAELVTLAFWDAYLKHDAAARDYLASDALKEYSFGAVTVEHK